MKTRKETYDKNKDNDIWTAMLKAEFVVSDDYDRELQERRIFRKNRVMNLVSCRGVELVKVLPNLGFTSEKQFRDGNTWVRYSHPQTSFDVVHLDLDEYPNIFNGTLEFL